MRFMGGTGTDRIYSFLGCIQIIAAPHCGFALASLFLLQVHATGRMTRVSFGVPGWNGLQLALLTMGFAFERKSVIRHSIVKGNGSFKGLRLVLVWSRGRFEIHRHLTLRNLKPH